jgi:hypothetical protein
MREGRIVPGETISWEESLPYMRWRNLTIQYAVGPCGQGEFSLRVRHAGASVWFGEPVVHDYTIGLVTTTPSGGRWWLSCPVRRGAGACGRKAGKLYLPLYGRRFGCRDCHQLSYLSRQEGYLKKRQDRLLGQGAG